MGHFCSLCMAHMSQYRSLIAKEQLLGTLHESAGRLVAFLEVISHVQTKLTELENQVKESERQSVEFGEQGDIDAAHAASTRADKLKVHILKAPFLGPPMPPIELCRQAGASLEDFPQDKSSSIHFEATKKHPPKKQIEDLKECLWAA